MKTPIELWQDLKQLVLSAEKDASKSTRGMKAGGVRLRNTMQEIRGLAMEVRKSVLEYRSSRSNDADESMDDEPIVELDETAIVEDNEVAAGASEVDSLQEAELEEPVHAKKPEAANGGNAAPGNGDSRNIPFWYSSFSY
ncbi:MAG: hypothetical protein AB7K09_14440 [Planctomycetota bacterium]